MTDIQIWQPQAAEVARYEPSGPLDDWIRVADQVVNLAKVIANSPFVPDGLRGSVPATAAAILTGRELQIPPMTALANIHVIHGRPGLSALVMRALIQSHGHEWRDIEVTNTRVIVEGRRRGSSEWTRASFSADDANRAKIQLGGYPQDKLYARATARLARRAFADVIAGMPYSSEELEDGLADEDSPAAEATPSGATEQPKPRTAQRATRPRTAPPAPAASTPAAAPPAAASGQQQDAGGALPPLPGEDEPPLETDYDSPGTATPPQLTRIWATLTGDYEFARDDKDAARGLCAQIISRPLASSKELSFKEAGIVIDTLANWIATAQAKGEHPRALMTAVLSGAVAVEEVPGDE
jgi:hypothetical protein